MDSQIKQFLREEKQSKTDKSHKCVAKKFKNWLLNIREESDPGKIAALSEEQDKAISE